MIISVTLSKPVSNIEEIFEKPYEKIKIKVENSSGKTKYFAEMFTKTQVFHKHFTEEELDTFLEQHAGTTFRNCIERTETQEITIMANKKGKITKLVHNFNQQKYSIPLGNNNNQKKYLISEGKPVPFLVLLGIMNSDGKIIAAKYDKFKQINRFLEFINDVIPEVQNIKKKLNEDSPIRIADFGCGKSYLTFAVHYFLTEIKHIPCQIEGLDLKEDVIKYCNEITEKLSLQNLSFHIGNIADYSGKQSPDIVITLHACDKATDYALKYAVERNAKAILSVPCCQHQINQQLSTNITELAKDVPDFSSLLKWGLIREKFSSLITDSLRGEWLEQQGYKVQMLEFIDIEHTPKNILIRAVNKNTLKKSEIPTIIERLKITPEIWN